MHFNPRSPCGERRQCEHENILHNAFQSTLPVRGATLCKGEENTKADKFQSTLPVRGATHTALRLYFCFRISIHAPRAGSDDERRRRGLRLHRFQSTLPVRGATPCAKDCPDRSAISIHAPRAGSDKDREIRGVQGGISIHAPRAGSDSLVSKNINNIENFNPRSPCGERPMLLNHVINDDIFQSTLPVRGATG